jgi:hypothetical protein
VIRSVGRRCPEMASEMGKRCDFHNAVDLWGRLSNPSESIEGLDSQGSTGLRDDGEVVCGGPGLNLSDRLRGRRDETGRLSNPVQRRLAPADVEELTSRYRAGATLVDLVARFGLHRSTIAAHPDREGVPRRQHRGWNEACLLEAQQMYDSGASLADVGQRFGVDAKTVANRFRRAGVRTRSRREWSRTAH